MRCDAMQQTPTNELVYLFKDILVDNMRSSFAVARATDQESCSVVTLHGDLNGAGLASKALSSPDIDNVVRAPTAELWNLREVCRLVACIGVGVEHQDQSSAGRRAAPVLSRE